MKRTIAVLAGLLFLAGTGLVWADAYANDGGITAAHKKPLKHHKGTKKGGKGATSHLKNKKNSKYGEDRVTRYRPGNNKIEKPELNPQPLPPGVKSPGNGGNSQTDKEMLNPQPLPPGMKPPPGQGGNNLK